MQEAPKIGPGYYKGFFSSDLQQRYTRDAAESSDAAMLNRNLKFAGFAAALLGALVFAFLFSNGLV